MKNLALVLVGVVALACGGGGDDGPAVPKGDRLFRGTIAGSASSGITGTIVLMVKEAQVANGPSVARARLALPTASAELSGSMSEAGAISLTGGGWNATMRVGGSDNGVNFSDLTAHGTLTSPGGEQVFATAEDATENPVEQFCGTYDGDDFGTWNFQTVSGRLSGSYSGGSLTGSRSGNSVNIAWRDARNAAGSASGSISVSSVSGSWSGTARDEVFGSFDVSGAWEGRACSAVVAAPSGSAGATDGGCCAAPSGFRCCMDYGCSPCSP